MSSSSGPAHLDGILYPEIEPYETGFLLAGDGQRAWDLVAEWHPDILVSDVVMPVLDGRELVRRLAASACSAEMPAEINALGFGLERNGDSARPSVT